MNTSLLQVGTTRRVYPSEAEVRRHICQTGQTMYNRQLIVASEGNLSAKIAPDRIVVTPAGICKGKLALHDLLIVDSNGKLIYGCGRPSSELQLHLLYYRVQPNAQAVCHAHPLNATAFAAAGRSLEAPVLPEVIVDLGTIPLAPYGTPGTQELCAGVEPFMADHNAILLENHGLITCGDNLDVAYQRVETVEHFAQVLFIAELLGGAHSLSRVQVQNLIAARGRY